MTRNLRLLALLLAFAALAFSQNAVAQILIKPTQVDLNPFLSGRTFSDGKHLITRLAEGEEIFIEWVNGLPCNFFLKENTGKEHKIPLAKECPSGQGEVSPRLFEANLNVDVSRPGGPGTPIEVCFTFGLKIKRLGLNILNFKTCVKFNRR